MARHLSCIASNYLNVLCVVRPRQRLLIKIFRWQIIFLIFSPTKSFSQSFTRWKWPETVLRDAFVMCFWVPRIGSQQCPTCKEQVVVLFARYTEIVNYIFYEKLVLGGRNVRRDGVDRKKRDHKTRWKIVCRRRQLGHLWQGDSMKWRLQRTTAATAVWLDSPLEIDDDTRNKIYCFCRFGKNSSNYNVNDVDSLNFLLIRTVFCIPLQGPVKTNNIQGTPMLCNVIIWSRSSFAVCYVGKQLYSIW